MPKVTVTYKAPENGAKTFEWEGMTFSDGKATEVEQTEKNAYALEKLADNPLFNVSGPTKAAGDTGPKKAEGSKAESGRAEDDNGDKAKNKIR
jgi:hypothetical protein